MERDQRGETVLCVCPGLFFVGCYGMTGLVLLTPSTLNAVPIQGMVDTEGRVASPPAALTALESRRGELGVGNLPETCISRLVRPLTVGATRTTAAAWHVLAPRSNRCDGESGTGRRHRFFQKPSAAGQREEPGKGKTCGPKKIGPTSSVHRNMRSTPR